MTVPHRALVIGVPETFDELPLELAAQILRVGQQLARRMKALYAVNRVAFVFTGGDVPHAHAHVVPMVEPTDITSGQYMLEPKSPLGSDHLRTDLKTLRQVAAEIGPINMSTAGG